MRKDDVYDLTEKLKEFLNELNGIKINENIYKIKKIEKLFKEVNYFLGKCTLSSYEEFSILTKRQYMKMLELKQKYKNEKDEEKKIYLYDEYVNQVKKYEGYKAIRDQLNK